MSEGISRGNQVIIRVSPAHSETTESSEALENGQEEHIRSFDAFVYSNFNIPLINQAKDLPADEPGEFGNLPLAGVEQVVVNWTRYKRYLHAFLLGEQAASKLLSRDEIFKEISPGLALLLSGQNKDIYPLRIWWSSKTPSLVKLPWELLAYESEGYVNGDISFVRGVPPQTLIPKLPVKKELRLAFIHEALSTPTELSEALSNIPGIELVDMTKPPLEALRDAVNGGFELVHLIADGSVSLAYEGFLYLRKPGTVDVSSDYTTSLGRRSFRFLLNFYQKIESALPEALNEWLSDKFYKQLDIETLTASELSALQRGSRLAVLSLSPPKTTDTDINRLDGLLLPSVYSSFACLGNSDLPMPNIVAQIGACDAGNLKNFWRGFYTELSESLSVEGAVGKGLKASVPLAVALFLRQSARRTFIREPGFEGENVTQINAELQQSKETLKRLHDLGDSVFSDIVSEYEQVESVRQAHLQAQIDPWLEKELPLEEDKSS